MDFVYTGGDAVGRTDDIITLTSKFLLSGRLLKQPFLSDLFTKIVYFSVPQPIANSQFSIV